MKLETTLSDRLRWVVFIRIHWISRSCPDTVGHAVDISWLCGVMLTSWRRWTMLAMPGWQATRWAPWMGTPMRAVYDIFLMKFDAQGVHLWTRQRGGSGFDYAKALKADGVRRSFFLRYLVPFWTEKHGKTLDPLARSCESVAWHPLKWINLLCAFTRFDISYLVKCLMEVWAMNFDSIDRAGSCLECLELGTHKSARWWVTLRCASFC